MKKIKLFEQFFNESISNSDILDMVDMIHNLINNIKSKDSKRGAKLFTLAGPFIKELHTLLESNIQSITEVNESMVSFKKMQFMLSATNDSNGLAIQFIPNSKTLEFSKNEQIEAIQSILNKSIPDLAPTLWYDIKNSAAGLIFRVDIYKLVDYLVKKIK